MVLNIVANRLCSGKTSSLIDQIPEPSSCDHRSLAWWYLSDGFPIYWYILIRHGVSLLNLATLLSFRRYFPSFWRSFAIWSPSKVRKKTWKGLSNLGLPLYSLCTPPLPFFDFSWGEGGFVHRLAPRNPGLSELTRRKLKCYEKSRVLFISLFFVMSTTAVH